MDVEQARNARLVVAQVWKSFGMDYDDVVRARRDPMAAPPRRTRPRHEENLGVVNEQTEWWPGIRTPEVTVSHRRRSEHQR